MLKLPQYLIAGSLSLVMAAASAMPGMAQLRDEYTLDQAQSGAVSLQVWPGSGTNLDFTSTGQFIYRAWLDDPSRVLLETDTPIENANAQIIHLRKIHAVEFEGLPATGVTLLSVATINTAGQRNLYQFRVSYGDNRPEYATISLIPQVVPSAVATIPANSAYGGAQLNTFRLGIAQLILNGTIEGDGPMHGRLKTFVGLVQNGSTPAEAVQTAGINLAVVQEVARIGLAAVAAERQSRFTEEAEPSNVDSEIEAVDQEAQADQKAEPVTGLDTQSLIESLRRMSTTGEGEE
jgi:hypothetical protein